MNFAAPAFLALVLLIPLGVIAQVTATRRRRRFVVSFPATATLAIAAKAAPAWRRRIPAVLLALSVAALAVALARPQAMFDVPIEEASVVLVTDASGSMQATDVAPSRLAAVKRAGDNFLDGVPDSLRVGMVGFSTTPHTVLRPTTDHEAVRATLDSMRANGGTATGDALEAALGTLKKRGSAKDRPPAAIVLLSDGTATAGRDPVPVARKAGAQKIPIYTVALGTADGTITAGPYGETIAVPPDPETMRQIAVASGGQSFNVADAGELSRVYEQLGRQVGTKPEQREVTVGAAALGLVLLAAAMGFGLRRRGLV